MHSLRFLAGLFGGLLIALQVIAAPQHPARVAIIDNFFPPAEGFQSVEQRQTANLLYGLVDLDRDREHEPYYHGDLVQLIAADPRFSFFRYPMRHGPAPMAEILANLRKLQVRQARYPVDALILSWESSTLISAFEKPLQRAHAKHYKALIRDWGKSDPVWRDTHAIILLLEALARQGVRVYTIAGNGGRGMVNTFSFADGVTTVGAREPELARFVSNNAFVDTYDQAAYFFTRVDGPDGAPLGYDIDGDHCIDIPLNRLSNFRHDRDNLPQRYWRPIKGSSFAAPRALRRALLKGLPVRGCAATTLRF